MLRTTKCDAFSEARRTKNRLLRYGMSIRCSKRPPGVRDASSEAFGVKNRLFWYGRDIRYRKQPPVVRDAFSETFGDKKGLLWYATHLQRCAKQPPAPPNAFSKAQNSTCSTERILKGPQNSRLHRLWTASCRTGRIFSARNGPRSLCSLRRPLPLLLRRHSVPETAPARM